MITYLLILLHVLDGAQTVSGDEALPVLFQVGVSGVTTKHLNDSSPMVLCRVCMRRDV